MTRLITRYFSHYFRNEHRLLELGISWRFVKNWESYCTISGTIPQTMKLWLSILYGTPLKTVELYYGFGMEGYEKNYGTIPKTMKTLKLS